MVDKQGAIVLLMTTLTLYYSIQITIHQITLVLLMTTLIVYYSLLTTIHQITLVLQMTTFTLYYSLRTTLHYTSPSDGHLPTTEWGSYQLSIRLTQALAEKRGGHFTDKHISKCFNATFKKSLYKLQCLWFWTTVQITSCHIAS